MRPPPTVGLSAGEVVEFGLIHLPTPLPSPPTGPTTCVSHACRWWPYSGSKEFEANAAMIIIVLLSALISALGLNAAIRCFLRGGRGYPSDRENNSVPQSRQALVDVQQKSNVATASCLEAAPTVIYTAEMKAKLAGVEAECAICLSEFVEGEGIRVLRRCKHGFHAQCIQKWLSSHSSCPTCRRTCLPQSPSQSPAPPQPSADHNPEQNPVTESSP
ncbi:hypothetical protein TB2_014727 [Malus domestica]|uniref:RING-H2 finger protein ATL79-like n=1 Tax=Malus domestica TaxID=3750 RepID=UPI0039755DF2